jgi:hypothetical protein
MVFDDMRDKPKGDEIRVSLNSGANDDSHNDAIVDASDLGFASKGDWDAATDAEKLMAVRDYFYDNGYPEWSWDDAESA